MQSRHVHAYTRSTLNSPIQMRETYGVRIPKLITMTLERKRDRTTQHNPAMSFYTSQQTTSTGNHCKQRAGVFANQTPTKRKQSKPICTNRELLRKLRTVSDDTAALASYSKVFAPKHSLSPAVKSLTSNYTHRKARSKSQPRPSAVALLVFADAQNLGRKAFQQLRHSSCPACPGVCGPQGDFLCVCYVPVPKLSPGTPSNPG